MSDLKDILNDKQDPRSDELLRYLEGNASEAERFTVENSMTGSSFMDEAVEGLRHFNDPAQLKEYVDQLNKQLQKQTAKKLAKKKKRKLPDQNWITIAILAILALCIAGYFLIHFHTKQ